MVNARFRVPSIPSIISANWRFDTLARSSNCAEFATRKSSAASEGSVLKIAPNSSKAESMSSGTPSNLLALGSSRGKLQSRAMVSDFLLSSRSVGVAVDGMSVYVTSLHNNQQQLETLLFVSQAALSAPGNEKKQPTNN